MKKIISVITLMILTLIFSAHAFADDGYSDDEYSRAVSISGDTWTEFSFDSDLLFKINTSENGTTTVMEIKSDDYRGVLQYYAFTKGDFTHATQNNVISVPGYIGIPHIDNQLSGYIKISYDSDQNANLRNKTLKVRLCTVSNDISGWESAVKIGLNEEHTLKFDSMNDGKWYKLVVPDEQFKYTYTMRTPGTGCFISELYTESDLMSGENNAVFSDCISIGASKCTITAQMGQGTYYLHMYPVPLYSGVLDSKIIFATDNKDSSEVVTTSFGALTSAWAAPEIEAAFEDNLIPEVMLDFDLTKKVNRGEFAAIAVQLYETIAKQSVSEATNCTFTDIQYDDNEKAIKKAYRIDVAQGTSAATYEPLSNINREQLATMLCRVIKKYNDPSWNIAADADYILNTSGVALFADDSEISDWAKPSVYFMAKNGIVKGISDTLFAPKNTTNQQEASGYASATREQAIILAQRIFKQSDMLKN